MMLYTGAVATVYGFGSTDTDAGFAYNGSRFIEADSILYAVTPYGGSVYYGDGALFSYNLSTGAESVLHSLVMAPMALILSAPWCGPVTVCFMALPRMEGPIAAVGVPFTVTIWQRAAKRFCIVSATVLTGLILMVLWCRWAIVYFTAPLIPGATAGHFLNMITATGTIFSYNIYSGAYQVLHNFGSGTDGNAPENALIQASNGLLYGTTGSGGVNPQGGTLFSYNIQTGQETVVT